MKKIASTRPVNISHRCDTLLLMDYASFAEVRQIKLGRDVAVYSNSFRGLQSTLTVILSNQHRRNRNIGCGD